MRLGLAVILFLVVGSGQADEGRYLLRAAGCPACHTAENGPALAGGRAFETRYGTFYSPNITPDRETGIGDWTRAQFIAALKHGTAPGGSAYFPVFPYPSYRLLSDQDAGLIFDHLQSTAPHHRPNREHTLPWWLARWMMKPWQRWVLDDPTPVPGAVAEDPQLERGHYLVNALAHCGECHTPRNLAGVAKPSRYLAGTDTGPEGDPVPNITPDRTDGIGRWDADDLGWFLESGELPDGDYIGGQMVAVIDQNTARLTPADRDAIVAYLRSVKAVPGT